MDRESGDGRETKDTSAYMPGTLWMPRTWQGELPTLLLATKLSFTGSSLHHPDGLPLPHSSGVCLFIC